MEEPYLLTLIIDPSREIPEYFWNRGLFWAVTGMASAIFGLLVYIYKMNRKQNRHSIDQLLENFETLNARLDKMQNGLNERINDIQDGLKDAKNDNRSISQQLDSIVQSQVKMDQDIQKLFKYQSLQNERIAKLEARMDIEEEQNGKGKRRRKKDDDE